MDDSYAEIQEFWTRRAQKLEEGCALLKWIDAQRILADTTGKLTKLFSHDVLYQDAITHILAAASYERLSEHAFGTVDAHDVIAILTNLLSSSYHAQDSELLSTMRSICDRFRAATDWIIEKKVQAINLKIASAREKNPQ